MGLPDDTVESDFVVDVRFSDLSTVIAYKLTIVH